MSTMRTRAAVLVATAITALALPAGSAAAVPACNDPVVGALHTVHDTVGDPAGAGHRVEETYCGVKP